MKPLLAIARVSFLATTRSHPVRMLAALLCLASAIAPSLVAFTFSGDDALAVAGAFGSAAILAPVAALFAGVALAAGDRAGAGLAPVLRGPSPAAGAVAAAAAGISSAAIGFMVISATAAAIALNFSGREFDFRNSAACLAAAAFSAPTAAAAGILLAVSAPRPLASALAALLAAAALAAPVLPAPEPGAPGIPAASVLLLARDAAFGPLSAAAVVLSCAASAAAAAALTAAAVAVLRAKDLAPRPGDA